MTLPVVDRTPKATRANRSSLFLLGLLLLAAGVGGLLLGAKVFGSDRAGRPVLDPEIRTFASEHVWFWLAVAAVGLLLAWLGWRWLRAQVGSARLRALDLEADRSRGVTRLHASALQGAVTDELTSLRGVKTASALLLGTPHDPELVVYVGLDGRETLRTVDAGVQADVVPHIREATDRPDLPVRIQYRLAPHPYRRIV